MGYYTYYTLNIYGGTPDRPIPAKIPNALSERLSEIFDDGWGESFYTHDKWYDWEEEMAEISLEYPEFTFELYGDGEESEDFWVAYIYKGQCCQCPGRVVYEDYNPKNMKVVKLRDLPGQCIDDPCRAGSI